MSALSESLQDAEFLLAFCARRGMPVDGGTRTAVATAVEEFAKNQKLAPAAEAAFFEAMTILSKAIQPATLDGLTAQFPSRTFSAPTGKVIADRGVRTYRNQAFIALVILFIAQVYWVIGSSISQDVEKLNADIYKQTVALRNRTTVVQAARGVPAADQAVNDIQAAIAGATDKLSVRRSLLGRWNKWNPLSWAFRLANVAPNQQIIAELQATQFALLILQSYILPLLYGWLGACVYILRAVGADIAGLAYAQYRQALYRMREALGALAGFAMAWLIGPKTEGVFASLPPLAAAFVAGYSVDLLFTLLDRIVAAFAKPAA